jgi:tetratricopeptide (TPR) repeat protein
MRLAQRLCLEAIRSDPRSAMAHEILGDIYARDGDTQRAATAYSYAIQFNPRHAEAQAKLDRLMNTTGPAGAGPTITYGGRAARRAEPAPTSGGVLTLVTILAGAALLASPFWLAFSSGDPIASLFGGTVAFSANLLAALALAGAAGGILLAFYGRMRPFKDELWRRTGEDGSPTRVPLGLTLSLVALVWLYASFLAYIGLAARHNRFSPSILRAYAMTLALVLVFTVAYRPSAAGATGWSATLLAGNLLFPAVLAGWVMGDALRLRGQM